jgi:hypothetical protein
VFFSAKAPLEDTIMNRLTLIVGIAAAVVLALGNAASARLGIAPLSVQDDSIIQVRGHGHRGGRGHHYGWGRGRGHHYGWRHHRHHRW